VYRSAPGFGETHAAVETVNVVVNAAPDEGHSIQKQFIGQLKGEAIKC
jgi:hypothetical protein